MYSFFMSTSLLLFERHFYQTRNFCLLLYLRPTRRVREWNVGKNTRSLSLPQWFKSSVFRTWAKQKGKSSLIKLSYILEEYVHAKISIAIAVARFSRKLSCAPSATLVRSRELSKSTNLSVHRILLETKKVSKSHFRLSSNAFSMTLALSQRVWTLRRRLSLLLVLTGLQG